MSFLYCSQISLRTVKISDIFGTVEKCNKTRNRETAYECGAEVFLIHQIISGKLEFNELIRGFISDIL